MLGPPVAAAADTLRGHWQRGPAACGSAPKGAREVEEEISALALVEGRGHAQRGAGTDVEEVGPSGTNEAALATTTEVAWRGHEQRGPMTSCGLASVKPVATATAVACLMAEGCLGQAQRAAGATAVPAVTEEINWPDAAVATAMAFMLPASDWRGQGQRGAMRALDSMMAGLSAAAAATSLRPPPAATCRGHAQRAACADSATGIKSPEEADRMMFGDAWRGHGHRAAGRQESSAKGIDADVAAATVPLPFRGQEQRGVMSVLTTGSTKAAADTVAFAGADRGHEHRGKDDGSCTECPACDVAGA